MSVNISAWNVVISATFFNPSVVCQHWLIKNKILEEADFLPGCIFSQALSQVVSTKFLLIVTPEHLQLFPQVPAADSIEELNNSVIRIVKFLEHTPFVAAGINFNYELTPSDGDVGKATRARFSGPSAIYSSFIDDDVRVGTYLSKNVIGARLRLDVKPITADASGNSERIRLFFNFNKDLDPDNKPGGIVELVDRWIEYLGIANEISGTLDREIP